MPKHNKTGRNKGEHGTFVRRRLMSSDAWRALSPKAQILYIWLRLEWKGARYNNNGRIQLSYRQAASLIGIGVNAAMSAFHELQAKGFAVVKEMGTLGVQGMAKSPRYELTDLPLPNAAPRSLYLEWKSGSDFQIVRHRRAKAKKKNP